MNLFLIAAIGLVLIVIAAIVMWRIQRRRPDVPSAVRTSAPSRLAAPRLRDRLQRTRHGIQDRLTGLTARGRLDDDYWAAVEDLLIAADLGVGTAGALVSAVRQRGISDPTAARTLLRNELARILEGRSRELELTQKPAVVLVVGVNGGGKTTSIAKLASLLQRGGSTVLLGAADTFRAAADQQLRVWADRLGIDMVGGQAGADPASVAFDAYHAARARGADTVIVDTAGRLHSKSNLMDELAKVARVLRREAGTLDEVLLVIDGSTGQNAIVQARRFSEAVGVTGIVVTKLDGTARGGVVIAIERELDIPVKFIGIGEAMDDLIPFEPEDFADAVLGP